MQETANSGTGFAPGWDRPIRVVSIMEAASVTGPAKNLIEFAKQARPRVTLSVITYVRGIDSVESNEFVNAVRAAGLSIHVVKERKRFDTGVIPQIKAILESCKPDIVQTHGVKSHFLMRYSGLTNQHNWLPYHHGYTAENAKMRLYNQLDRWSLLPAEHLMTVCQVFREELVAQGISRQRISVRHNSVAPFQPAPANEVHEVRQSLRLDARPILITVGRLSKEKGHVDFLDALNQLPGEILPCQTVIVGEGAEREKIEAFLTSHPRVAGSVRLAGFQREIRPYLTAADVFVLPSHSEGSPNALLEAMAAALPIVATTAGGITELVRDPESAYMSPPKDASALSQSIQRALADQEEARRRGQRAKEIADKLTPEANADFLVRFYEDILSHRKPDDSKIPILA